MTIGWAEIFIILYLILPFLLRKRYPLHIKLGALLGLFNPLGQFYVEKDAVWYFVGLLAFGMVVQYLFFPEVNMLFITAGPGALLNVYRIEKEKSRHRSRNRMKARQSK